MPYGLNILAGAYSGAPRLHDDPFTTAFDTLGRISGFENPGSPASAATWTRHDISRRVLDINVAFVPVDFDKDGDLDGVSTRGNSTDLDGVFWLEQVRTPDVRRQFTLAGGDDSRQMPLPPKDWIDHYRCRRTYTQAANTE